MAQNNKKKRKKKKIGDEILFALYSSFTVFFLNLFFITFYALSYKIFMIP